MKNHRRFAVERLERRELLTGIILEYEDIGYFFDADSTTVERYNIEAESWLSPVDLDTSFGSPTSAHIDSDGMHIGHDKTLYRYDLNGANPMHILDTEHTITDITSDGNLLFVAADRYISFDKLTSTVIHARHYADCEVFSIVPSKNRLLMRNGSTSSHKLCRILYDDMGHFSGGSNSLFDLPRAHQTWVFPDEIKVNTSSCQGCNTNDDITLLSSRIPDRLTEDSAYASTSLRAT